MGISAETGPSVVFGISNTGSSIPAEYNEERGPSLVDLGDAMMDPRPAYNYTPGQAVGHPTYGLWSQMGIVDCVPAAASTNGIAATQSAAGNAPLTLTATGAGITSNVTLVAPETGKNVTGLLAIDYTSPGLTYGSAGTIRMWNPTNGSARCITITSSVNDSGGAYTVIGRDLYGYKITELIVGPNNATVTTQHAFKYIAAITSSGTINSTGVYVGYSNTFGFPIRVDYPGNISIWQGNSSNASLVNTSTGAHTFASTSVATTSTGPDTRGTYTSTTTFNSSTIRLQMYCMPAVQNITALTSQSAVGLANGNLAITSTNFSGIFGFAPFSSV